MSNVADWIQKELNDEDFDLCAVIRERRESEAFSILKDCLDILAHDGQKRYWKSAATIIYWLMPLSDQNEFPKMGIVARLYWCLIRGGAEMEDAENLVWSIAKDLKGVEYLSDWDPMKDPEVAKYMAEMG